MILAHTLRTHLGSPEAGVGTPGMMLAILLFGLVGSYGLLEGHALLHLFSDEFGLFDAAVHLFQYVYALSHWFNIIFSIHILLHWQ